MKLTVKVFLLLCLTPPSILVLLLALAVDRVPLLHHRAELTPQHIAQGKRIFEQNDPRRLKSGLTTKARLPEKDLNLAINYMANQLADGVAGLAIDNGRMSITASLTIPENPFGKFLNIRLELRQTVTLPVIQRASVGSLRLPVFLAGLMLEAGATKLSPVDDWHSLVSMIKQVEFQRRHMTVLYQWRDDLPGKLSGALWAAAEQKRLEIYQGRLAELTLTIDKRLNMNAVLNPLFQLAVERSRKGEALAENRAILLVLAFYITQKDLSKLMPAAASWPKPQRRVVTLKGREDLCKHYLISAMLAAYAGTPLADAVGLYKEIEDARGGSGFSFNDIAADRAGRLLGELATVGDAQALALQEFLVSATENDLMPKVDDLPEFIPEQDFQRRFGGSNGENYRRLLAEIDNRIANLPIYRRVKIP
ncbi:MAG: hypothetical protein PHH11_12665 [Methylomonas sp.]|nr:hypothetical protein [Methylomonas sp.]